MNDDELNRIIRLTVAETLNHPLYHRSERIAYPIKEAAMLVGLPRSTLDDARSRGEFKAVKRCSRWMVTRAELVRWMSDR